MSARAGRKPEPSDNLPLAALPANASPNSTVSRVQVNPAGKASHGSPNNQNLLREIGPSTE